MRTRIATLEKREPAEFATGNLAIREADPISTIYQPASNPTSDPNLNSNAIPSVHPRSFHALEKRNKFKDFFKKIGSGISKAWNFVKGIVSPIKKRSALPEPHPTTGTHTSAAPAHPAPHSETPKKDDHTPTTPKKDDHPPATPAAPKKDEHPPATPNKDEHSTAPKKDEHAPTTPKKDEHSPAAPKKDEHTPATPKKDEHPTTPKQGEHPTPPAPNANAAHGQEHKQEGAHPPGTPAAGTPAPHTGATTPATHGQEQKKDDHTHPAGTPAPHTGSTTPANHGQEQKKEDHTHPAGTSAPGTPAPHTGATTPATHDAHAQAAPPQPHTETHGTPSTQHPSPVEHQVGSEEPYRETKTDKWGRKIDVGNQGVALGGSLLSLKNDFRGNKEGASTEGAGTGTGSEGSGTGTGTGTGSDSTGTDGSMTQPN